MCQTDQYRGAVRWIDAVTGEDFTDRMNDPDLPPAGPSIIVRAQGIDS